MRKSSVPHQLRLRDWAEHARSLKLFLTQAISTLPGAPDEIRSPASRRVRRGLAAAASVLDNLPARGLVDALARKRVEVGGMVLAPSPLR